MKKAFLLMAAMLATVATCSATVVVDGVPGGDTDGTSPFETAQAAVKYAIAHVDPIVEIQENATTGGVTLDPAIDFLQDPLTIRAGVGFQPVFTRPFVLNTATPNQPITLQNIKIDLAEGSDGAALYAAGNITLTTCSVLASHQGGGHYPIAIAANLLSPESTGVLTITNSTLSGNNAILAGHSIKDYNLTSCTVLGITSDIPAIDAAPIANIMNWHTNAGGGLDFKIDSTTNITLATNASGATTTLALAPIGSPLTLTLDKCILRSNGQLLGWPPSSLESYGATYYDPGNDNTIGPVHATNCVFDGVSPVSIGSTLMSATQNPGSTFVHCTFRTNGAGTGAIRLRGKEAAAYSFKNCFIDSPAGLYGIGIDAASQPNITVTGDGNVYAVKPGTEYVTLADIANSNLAGTISPFETTTHTYAPPSTGSIFLTNPNGVPFLPYGKTLVGAKAVALAPPVINDIFGNSRPQPTTATLADVGAVEFDETVPNAVQATAFDSSSPGSVVSFSVPQDAISYAVANGKDTVEIQTDTPSGGFALVPETDFLQKVLTVRSKSGFHPVFTSPLTINPANPGTTVTIQDIDITLPFNSDGSAVYAAGNVVMTNCQIQTTPSIGHYPVGIATNLLSPGSLGMLTLNGCLVTGHNAILAGHSIKDYILNDTTVIGITSNLAWGYTATVVNIMNWETNSAGNLTALIDSSITIPVINGSGVTSDVTLAPIDQPRTLTMNRCVLRSNGELLAWPPNTLETQGNMYYGDSNNHTIGPVTATNCVFDGCNPVMIGSAYFFPGNQNPTSTFVHCTFRTNYGVTGAVRLRGPDAVVDTFDNCLFDSPQGLYGIGIDGDSLSITLAGDGNVYCIAPGVENVILPSQSSESPGTSTTAFESTTHTYAAPVLPAGTFLTNPDGTMALTYGKGLAGGKAVALIPAITEDIYHLPRPNPISAAKNDVGATEFDETPAAEVGSWTLY